MKIVVAALSLAGALACSSAHAGVHTDNLSNCLVKSTNASDQLDLMRWLFSALASHPQIKAMSNITPEQRTQMDKTTAALFQRLILTDCRSEAVAALKNEGPGAMESSFNVLGQIAGRSLFAAPEVAASMAGLQQHVDTSKLSALYIEAGVTPQ